jgi:hypothetical protein
MYDLNASRLCEMVGDRQVEVNSRRFIRNVRFNSTEISLDGALDLIRWTKTKQ